MGSTYDPLVVKPEAGGTQQGGRKSRTFRERILIVGIGLLQVIGDPRWWPRDLPLPREKLLWRKIKRADPSKWPPPITEVGRAQRLKGLAEAQYDEARLWFLLTTQLYVVGAVLAGFAFLIEPARIQLTVATAACQIFAAFARIRAARLHSIAHQANWRALLLDAMEPTEAELERAVMFENTLSDGARRRAGVLPNYFTSDKDRGPERLIDNVRQTAFVTGALFGGAKVQAFFLVVVVVAIPLSGPIYWLTTGSSLPPEAGVLLVTAVLPLWDAIGRQRSWGAAAVTLEEVVESLRTTGDLRDALPQMVDAMTATAMAPPPPRTIYLRWLKEGLLDRWKLMRPKKGGGPPAPGPAADI
jgi:hypothetical protein